MRSHKKKEWATRLGLAWLVLCAAGCGGALRSAAYEHALATQAVASTLKRAVALVVCEQSRQDAVASCKASVQVIALQAEALEQSAARLQSASGAKKE
jgi:hypothetical protein